MKEERREFRFGQCGHSEQIPLAQIESNHVSYSVTSEVQFNDRVAITHI